MGRGGKVSCKRNFKRRVRSKDKESDDSDEDYVVSNEENEISDDESVDYCNVLDGDASEENFSSFVEEEEEEEEEWREVRKVFRSKGRKGPPGVFIKEEEGEEEEKEVKKVGRSKAKKGSLGVFVEDEKEEEEEEEEAEAEEEEGEEREVRNVGRSKAKRGSFGKGKNGDETSRKRKRVSYEEEEDDEDYEEEEEDTDEEFTPDDDDCLDEEEEPMVTKKKNNMKVQKMGRQKKGSGRGRKKRRKTMVPKKPLAKKGRKNRRLRRKVRSHDDDDDYDDGDGDFVDNSLVVREKSKKNSGRRKRRNVVQSDSDFMSSGSSDYEYTISEEEREQVREANQFFRSLRSSSSVKKIQEVEDLHQPRKPPVRKGKEKVEEVKSEVVRQVCGICFSEEDKRRLRGTLDCCSHFFCFTCIMEWSKVESRCPLCKQRFKTITKPARSMAGVDLRNVVITVPQRDQVYQPSEEELRSYLDPYENVTCSECHEGGDDALMLLCDQCDSSAHTYCVGLGQQVPEGNWYCDGCRPVALESSSSQAQDPLPDQRTTSNNLFNRPSPVVNLGEGLDPNLVPSPRTPINQGFGNLPSPRFPVGDVQAASPVSGAGAPTLSGRRWIHRQIQNLLSINRMAGRADGVSTANSSNNFLNSQIDQGRETAVQQTRTQEMGTLHHSLFEGRLQNNPSSSLQNRDIFPSRLSHLRRQAVQDINTIATDRSINLTLWPDHGVIGSIPGYEQLHQSSSRSSIGSDGNLSPYAVREESQFYIVKEQLQSMVKSHLKNLSRDIELGNCTFKDIARSSTHTILAACGLEHRRSEVHTVPPPSMCTHMERIAAGQTSLMKGFCPSCFDSFVRDVVKMILDTRLPQWLSLGL